VSENHLQTYYAFKVRNGIKASRMVEVLRILEEQDALFGFVCYDKHTTPTSVAMFSPARVTKDFAVHAADPVTDEYGLRGTTHLSDKPSAIEELIFQFPEDISMASPVLLPLNPISETTKPPYSISDVIAVFAPKPLFDDNSAVTAPKQRG
jgi:hypothetical protein